VWIITQTVLISSPLRRQGPISATEYTPALRLPSLIKRLPLRPAPPQSPLAATPRNSPAPQYSTNSDYGLRPSWERAGNALGLNFLALRAVKSSRSRSSVDYHSDSINIVAPAQAGAHLSNGVHASTALTISHQASPA